MSDSQNGVPVTYVTDPPVAAGMIQGGTIAVHGYAGQYPVQVVVQGGTIETTISFSGSVHTDLGDFRLEDQNNNYAVIPDASVAKDGNTNALVVQHIDDTGTPLRESTQVAVLVSGSNTNDLLANIDLNTMAATTYLAEIANTQGTQSTALLQTVVNQQGTLATSANQTTEIALLSLIDSRQGTQSTAGLATTALQTTGNAIATVIMNNEGTLAANNSLVALNNQIASVISVLGPVGTDARNHVHVEMALNPGAPSTDSFGRLRVSNPDFRFDGQFCYQISPDLWDTAYTGGGTVSYDRTDRLAQLTSTANGTAVMQSHYCAPYTPGRSQLALLSFQMGTTPGYLATRRVGYWDGSDGVYLEQASDGVRLVLASSTSNGNQTVPQASWNIDKMDGTGPSGFTLDLSKIQILAISFQALYAGRVVVGFDIDGVLCLVHQFNHANKISVPYFAQASLPVRYEAKSTGSNVVSLKAACASVMSEGGGPLSDIPSRAFSANTGATTVSVSTRRPLLSLRCKTNFNGVVTNGLVYPADANVITGNQAALVEVVRNASFTGTAWTSVDTNSIAEFDTSASAITGGQTLYSTYVQANNAQEIGLTNISSSRLVIAYSQLTRVTDTISIVMTSLSANTSSAACFNWKEIR